VSELELHRWICLALLVLAPLVLIVLLIISAPYGRHDRPGWGPSISSQVGWIAMEMPSLAFFAWVFIQGRHALEPVPLLFGLLWIAHYTNRVIVFPLRRRTAASRMPLLIVGIALVFNGANAWVNARWVSELGVYTTAWALTPFFLVGMALFVTGAYMNIHADERLRTLRAPGETGYRIPRGGAYELVSCPNYLGEILEWTGWAIATWSLAGLAFAAFTAANLLPRAIKHHQWYREKFADYPRERRAILPFVL